MTGEKLYSFVVLVNLHEPVPSEDHAGRSLVGYYRTFCVRAGSETEAKERVAASITDGVISWRESELRRTSIEELSIDHEKRLDLSPDAAFIYQSGRVFF